MEEAMKVVVLGAGHGGTATAADLASKGHEVSLVKTSKSMHGEHFEQMQDSRTVRVIEGDICQDIKLESVTTDLEKAVATADIIVVFVQSTYHSQLIERLAPHLRDGQLLLFEPGYLATALVRKHAPHVDVHVAEATSSPLDCRITSPGEVTISFRNVANHVALSPGKDGEQAASLLQSLGYNWIHLESPIEAALHNPNLIVHTIGGLMSIPRIEATRGDYWMYKEVFSPTVWNLVESLDAEKMAVLSAMGLKPLSYVEAAKQRNAPDDPRPAEEIFFDYAQNSSVKGPTEADSRYLTEDIPQGLVLMESLGERSGVPTPVCSAMIDLAEALLLRDFRENGRTAETLELGTQPRPSFSASAD